MSTTPPPLSPPSSELSDLRSHNARLLEEIDSINRSHILEIRRIRESYETELEERARTIEALEQRLIALQCRNPALTDQDRIIQSNENRIDQLTERCRFELEARSQQLDRLAETLARLEKVILDNDRLRNRPIVDDAESPFRPDQARRLHLPNPVFEVDTPRPRVQIPDSPRFRETITPRVKKPPDGPSSDSPPRFDGRRRAPPDHRALVDQLGVRPEQQNEINLDGMTVTNMRKNLATLEEDRAELGRKINRPLQPVRNLETLQKKIERENDEKEYDLICRMIMRIRGALQGNRGGKVS